jgi:pimeloyl-ACP methyl ester carboxylesterase
MYFLRTVSHCLSRASHLFFRKTTAGDLVDPSSSRLSRRWDKLPPHAENALYVNSQGGFEMAKPTIVLVHGFWGGAAHWSKVIQRLNKKGYTSLLRSKIF